MTSSPDITDVIGRIPYRMQFSGGWIDQPFVSKLNPERIGSMVVVALKPTVRYMDRSGMATGTRKVAMRLWKTGLPDKPLEQLVRDLYAEENRNAAEPSGSQDMIGIIYPGVNRLDYDFSFEAGIFPRHIESNNDPKVAAWLEQVVHMIPVAPRPDGYNPLGVKNLDPQWIRRLGQSGKDCFDAIVARDIKGLGESMNQCMSCWANLLPQVVKHPAISIDLMALWEHYRSRYAGAMYSGCGGGYLYVISNEPVPGSFKVDVRIASQAEGSSR